MGKRKKSSRKPTGPKKREPLATKFQCLFCNHENSVTVKMDKKLGTGTLNCKICGQSFQTGINYLSAAVDVYSEWIDACDAVAKDQADGAGRSGSYRDMAAPSHSQGMGDEMAEGDGFVVNDEDAEGDYDD